QRRQWIVAYARRFERIAAGLELPADIAGLAGDRRGIFKLVVIGFELGVSNAPVLDRHVVGDEFLAVALFVIGANFEFQFGPAPGGPAPVPAGAPPPPAGQERAEPAHRQRLLLRIVAYGDGVTRGVLHQIVSHDITQLVADIGQRMVALAGTRGAALKCYDLKASLSQFLGKNPAGPAEPNDDDIDFSEFGGHGAPPQLMSEMPSGLFEIGRA